MKNIKFISILIAVSILLTSCSGSRELNEFGIITATALDMENGKIILTNEVVIPSATERGSPIEDKVMYVQSMGDTVFEAYRNATLEFDRKLYAPHNMVLILGEELAKEGIGTHISDFANEPEQRETVYMMVAKGDKGYNLLGINAGLGTTSGDYLRKLIENFKYTSKSRILMVYEYFKSFFEYEAPVLGVVQKVEKAEIGKKKSKDEPSKTVLDVTGGAVFKDDKLKGYYTEEEMIGFNFMVNHVDNMLIVFTTPDILSDDESLIATKGKFTSIRTISSKTKKSIKIVDGQLHLDIIVRIKGVLGEETKGLRITDLPVKNVLQKDCSDKVEEYIRTVMDKAQKQLQVDNFEIKKLVYTKYPDIWEEVSKDWDENVFPNISYSVNVDTAMVRTGLINIPVNIKKGRYE